MKAIIISGLLTFWSLLLPRIATAQEKSDSTGLPGDNFSLEGALELFKQSSNLEEFEKKLNDKSSNVNNLDLNNDGKVDYVKVTDKISKDIHAIILRVNVNAKESQDVAVLAVEKTGDKSAVVQIIGDEELYGKNVLAEPVGEDEASSGPQGKGPYAPEVRRAIVIVNVWYWPCVQYIYMPGYTPWSSPWYWGYYPSYWYAWEPYPWHYHYQHCAPYRRYHHVVYVHRINHGPAYRPYRQSSRTVRNHYQEARRSSQSAANGRQEAPAGRRNQVNDQPVTRPVEGTQGARSNRRAVEQTPERQVTPVERQNTQPPSRRQQRSIESEPRHQPRISAPPSQAPQRQPQISQPRQRSPQINSAPQRANPPMRQSPPSQVPRGGRR